MVPKQLLLKIHNTSTQENACIYKYPKKFSDIYSNIIWNIENTEEFSKTMIG